MLFDSSAERIPLFSPYACIFLRVASMSPLTCAIWRSRNSLALRTASNFCSTFMRMYEAPTPSATFWARRGEEAM